MNSESFEYAKAKRSRWTEGAITRSRFEEEPEVQIAANHIVDIKSQVADFSQNRWQISPKSVADFPKIGG